MELAKQDIAEDMTIVEQVTVQVLEEHHVAQARQAAMALAKRAGFRKTPAHFVATSVSELANNLVFHARCGGMVTLVALQREGEVGIEVVAEDDGPGISDVLQAMQDGYSTNRGLGCGLPSVERLMDEFEITSTLGEGTRVLARIWQPTT